MIGMTTPDTLASRRGWTGDLAALAAEASRVQAELGMASDDTNARNLRHYQQKGCIGKASARDGAKGVYGFRHLLEAVAVRIMLAHGLSLTLIGEALSAMPDERLESMVSEQATASAPAAGPAGAADAAPGPGPDLYAASAVVPEAAPQPAPSPAASEALALLAGFRQEAGLSAPSGPAVSFQARGAGRIAAPGLPDRTRSLRPAEHGLSPADHGLSPLPGPHRPLPDGGSASSSGPRRGLSPASVLGYLPKDGAAYGTADVQSPPPPLPLPKKVAEYAIAPWLRVSVDETALERAEPGARARAVAEAMALIASFRT